MTAKESVTLRNALTVDVEDYFHVNAFSSVIDRPSWPQFQLRVERNTHRLLDLFANYRVQGTFFILGWVAQRVPTLIRQIHAAGHEIACHGLNHELVYNQTPEIFLAQTSESKKRLEDITGTAVRGYRAASYSVTARSIWALRILEDLGFAYDSSVFPVMHDVYGMPDAPRGPYRPSGGTLLEIPLTTVEWAGMRLPCAGGGYFRILPYTLFRWALRRVNDADRMPVMFYLHPWEVDPEQPRVTGAPLLSKFRHYYNLRLTEPRLKRLLHDFSWGRVDQVFDLAMAGAALKDQ
jgi:polysaccharide deacetylase family protein (PEP-CTERM system associated)